MKYYVGFFRQKSKNNIFARAIQIAMDKDYNHVEILEWDGISQFNDSLSYGSVSPLSRKEKFSKVLDSYYLEKAIELDINVTEAQANKILNSLMGKPYSKGQILIICAKLLMGRLLNFLPYVKLNLTKYLICTELVGIFMQEACGYRFWQSVETLTINEVEEIALKNLKRFL